MAELERGRAGALELEGEPGIGKTRLLAELGLRADRRGWLVLSGSAAELEGELPFAVFVDALDEYLRSLAPHELGDLDEDALGELGQVFPALSGGDRARPGDRYRTHRAVCRLLEALARSKPLVLLLDDLHWADAGSLDLLGSLLRRPPAAAVLIAMALRPRQVPDRLSGPLERAWRGGGLTRLELGALSSSEARQLLGERIEEADLAALYEQANGNPFYLEQLARTTGAATSQPHNRDRRSRSRACRCRARWRPPSPRSWRCCRQARGGCSTVRRSRATRSSSSSPAPPPGSPKSRRWKRSTSC